MSARRKLVTPTATSPDSSRAAVALPPTFLPSVHDLGLAFGAAIKESLASTDSGPNTPKDPVRARWVEQVFTPRADALRELITTLPLRRWPTWWCSSASS